jgi:hypothetical protein
MATAYSRLEQPLDDLERLARLGELALTADNDGAGREVSFCLEQMCDHIRDLWKSYQLPRQPACHLM